MHAPGGRLLQRHLGGCGIAVLDEPRKPRPRPVVRPGRRRIGARQPLHKLLMRPGGVHRAPEFWLVHGELRQRELTSQRRGAQKGQSVFARLDALEIPSVAVVQGFALGGGLELALACTFRIATEGARFGLPEIKLGLIPGYGGTQRLPRLVGEARALDMSLSGRTVKAEL